MIFKSNQLLIVILLSGVFLTVGCTTSYSKMDSKVYTSNLYSKSISKISKGSCPGSQTIRHTTKWKTLIEYGNSCVSQKRWNKVELVGNMLASGHIYSPWGAYYLSLSAEAADRIERSNWMIDIALKKAPGQGVLLFQKGRLLWKMGEFEIAVEHMYKALNDDSSLNSARIFLAQIELRDQQFSKAYALFSEAVKFAPDSAVVRIGLAECLIIERNWKEAVSHLDRAISNGRARMDIRLRRASILEKNLEDSEGALKAYRKIRYLKRSKKLAGPLPKDINARISRLEKVLKEKNSQKKISKRGLAKVGRVAK